MPSVDFSLAILGHLVGDYLLQNDWMALNKKRRSLPCAVHCAIWTAAVCYFTGWGWVAALALFAMHFAQDRTEVITWWMNRMGQRAFVNGPCAPWSVIVVDNVWHLLQIWLVWRFMA